MELRDSSSRGRPVAWALWAALLVLMLVGLGTPGVTRTQEARVLETAREMLGAGWRNWIVPHVNGRVRLEKPPLTYWMAAASFKLFGVNEFAGRLPFAIVGWLTVGLAYAIGARLYGFLAGLLGAAALAGSYMFARNARLAETDGPATLFVAAAVWWAWLGSETEGGARAKWLHLSAAAMGLALMSKQGTVAYPILFVLTWSAFARGWRWLLAWVTSGAVVTFLVVGLPWWVVTIQWLGRDVFVTEFHNVTEGKDHHGQFYEYLPMLAQAAAPWVGLMVVALIAAIGRWRQDVRLRGLLLWAGAVIVPLCFIGNKQYHYLMPAMPPLMILTGWAAAEVLRNAWPQRDAAIFRAVLLVTLVVLLGAGVGVLVAGHRVHGRVELGDILLSMGIFLVAAWGLAVFMKRPGAAGLLVIVLTPIVMLALVSEWAPTLQRRDHRTVALELRRRFGDGPYAFYGANESMTLAWGLRAAVPQYPTREALEAALAREPRLIVIGQEKNKVEPPAVPEGLEQVGEERVEDQVVRVYRRRP